MVRTLVASLIAFAAGLPLSSAPAAAVGTQPEAMIVLHAVEHVWPPISGAPCGVGAPATACRNYRVNWPVGSSADVYLVVARAYPGPGIAGLSCGIWYDPDARQGVDMFGWTLCADMEYTNAGAYGVWPAAGGGNRIVWGAEDNCQRTVFNPDGLHAIAGAFYVYAYGPDRFSVTANTNLAGPDELAVSDCSAVVTYLPFDRGAWVGFGDLVDSYNPCVGATPIPVNRTTWGQIKAKY